ncbi:MAG TPA: alpha/beta hydrolase domain-containing protein, partial [Pyrinomonadaceae bacterium]
MSATQKAIKAKRTSPATKSKRPTPIPVGGVIEEPLTYQKFGTFNGMLYVLYKGRFAGINSAREDYSVPYEIVAPVQYAGKDGRLVVEPPHSIDRLIVRDGYLTEFLFERRYSHAAVGFAFDRNNILDPEPGFDIRIKGQPYDPQQPVDDLEIIAHFADALRRNPHGLTSHVRYVYSAGISEAGYVVRTVLLRYRPTAFDLSFPSLAPVEDDYEPPEGVGKIIIFNSEWDFNTKNVPSNDKAFPFHRFYAVAGAPHIPDTLKTRLVFPGPPPLPPIA